MAMKAKHAFGSLSDVEKAIQDGKINSYDILFLDGDTEPKIGWIDKNNAFRLVKNEADFSELEAIIDTKANASDVEALETEISTKISVTEAETLIEEKVVEKVAEVEAAYEVIEF